VCNGRVKFSGWQHSDTPDHFLSPLCDESLTRWQHVKGPPGLRAHVVPRHHPARGVTVAPSFGFHSRLDLACELSTVRYARGHAEDILCGWGVADETAYDALTIVSELTTNAVRHAGADAVPSDPAQGQPRVRWCSLVLWIAAHDLYVAVHDEGLRAPVLRPASDESENGRGLQLVAGLSEGAWGFSFTTDRPGKLVWAKLPLGSLEQRRQPSAPLPNRRSLDDTCQASTRRAVVGA
jgi:serine/threonine-protein kinase RsbW